MSSERDVPLTLFLEDRRSFNFDTPSRAVRRARRAQKSLVTWCGRPLSRPPPIGADRVVLSGGRKAAARRTSVSCRQIGLIARAGSVPVRGSPDKTCSGQLVFCAARSAAWTEAYPGGHRK